MRIALPFCIVVYSLICHVVEYIAISIKVQIYFHRKRENVTRIPSVCWGISQAPEPFVQREMGISPDTQNWGGGLAVELQCLCNFMLFMEQFLLYSTFIFLTRNDAWIEGGWTKCAVVVKTFMQWMDIILLILQYAFLIHGYSTEEILIPL